MPQNKAEVARPRMPGRPSQRHAVKMLLRRAGLSTVCEEARCPNLADCFGRGTATFLILGDICTRRCGFCAVGRGKPLLPAADEPQRVARTANELGLRHVVVTSVTRDDLADGGADHFRNTILALRAACPGTTVEVLVPDFGGRSESWEVVLGARPDVWNHNLETVPRLYPQVRPAADFARSLQLLRRGAERGTRLVKSGIMVGLGEQPEEVEEVLRSVHSVGCGAVTVGQYLQPRRDRLPVLRKVEEDEYRRFRELGRRLGMRVEAGPLVRSSWRARELFAEAPGAGRLEI